MPRPPPAKRAPRPAGPAPSEAALRDAALAYLARFAATEAGLLRVLDRRIANWTRRAGQEGVPAEAVAGDAERARAAARSVAAAMAGAGAVDDRLFAEARGRSLARAGRSRRASLAYLSAKGVPADTARDALPDPELELASALAYARRRRLGPFRVAPVPPEGAAEVRRRELASLARAGFPAEVAGQALRTTPEQAEDLVARLRQA